MGSEPSYQYTVADIQRYFSGTMPAKEMHNLEKAALSDPFLADAMDGYRNADTGKTKQDLETIDRFLLKNHKGIIKTLPAAPQHRMRYIVAAASFVLLATMAWWFMHPPAGTGNNVALEQPVADTQAHVPTPVTVLADTIKKAADSTITNDTGQQQTTANKSQSLKPAPVATVAPVTLTTGEPAANSPVTIADSKGLAAPNIPEKQKTLFMKASQPYVIQGTVNDIKGNPVPYASLTGNRNQYSTDANGRFSFRSTDSAMQVSVTAIGYKNEVATLLAGRVAGVALTPNQESLNDVVVVGYGARKQKAAIGAINANNSKMDTLQAKESPYPQGGWDSFYVKLSQALQVNQSKADKLLHIKFSIDENGEPENFTVVKTPDTNIAAKAIDIIKKGPRWKKGRKKRKAEVKLQVE